MELDFSKEIVLENERVKLSPLSQNHASGLGPAAFAHKDLLAFSFNKIHTPELLEKAIQVFLDDRKKETRYPFVIFDKSTQQYGGVTTLMSVSNHHERLEIGSTWIGREFHRTGLNRNCKFLLMRYVFETLEFERLEFKTDARNEQSRTAIQKVGGKYEGEFRSHSVMPDGFRRNTIMYSVLKEEWPAIKSSVFKEYF